MQKFYNLIDIILILYLLSLTKEDICGEGEISISGLGKCKNITDILQNRDLNLKNKNLLYLASNNEGKIEKNGYKLEIYKLNDPKLQSHNMRKSKLYIPNTCLNEMEKPEHFGLDRNKGIVIIVYDSNNLNDNNITDNYFIILHMTINDQMKYITSKTDDLSFCHEDPILLDDEIELDNLKYSNNINNTIDIDKILYGRKNGIDLFNPYSKFLNDICFKFTSENGFDVTLESRLEDYYQNISFCDDRENSHYIEYNYSDTKKTFIFRCAFGYYENEEDKSSYLDIIDTELKSLVSVSNLKVIRCYRKFLNLRDIIRNYGGMICILVLILQIVCLLIFCFTGIKPLEDKLDDMFILGKVILRRLTRFSGYTLGLNIGGGNEMLNVNKNTNKKKINIWGQLKKIFRQRELEAEKKKKKGNNPPKKDKHKRRSSKSSKAKILKEKEEEEVKIDIVNVEDETNKNNNANEPIIQPKNEQEDKNQNQNIINSIRDDSNQEINLNSIIISNKIDKNDNESENKKNKDLKINEPLKSNDDNKTDLISKDDESKTIDEDQKSDDSQLYEYQGDELNELAFDKVLERDDRTFCQYYGSILLFSHIVLNVFFHHEDYNLFTVKLGLLFMTFPINLTCNLFFYTNKSIKLSYIKNLDSISEFWDNFANSIYSSILSMTLLIMLKLLCLTHSSVKHLRKMKNLEKARQESVGVLRCVKARIIIYYILSMAFLIIFGYYVLCFCAIFENTQVELIKSTFTSWLISLIYPFILCFITALIRRSIFRSNGKPVICDCNDNCECKCRCVGKCKCEDNSKCGCKEKCKCKNNNKCKCSCKCNCICDINCKCECGCKEKCKCKDNEKCKCKCKCKGKKKSKGKDKDKPNYKGRCFYGLVRILQRF